jgi:PAS domain S-box-containing protein
MRVSEGAAPATILVVEDERSTRTALTFVLKKAGFQVREAETAAEALRLLCDRPDLILLDVGLPDADGYAFCRQLKDDSGTATIPVLLLSGLGTRSEERVHGLDCGADGYLAKPADRAELVAQVKALLRLRHAEESLRQSERRYRELFNASPQPMWVCERETLRYLAVNDAAVARYGYSRAEFLVMSARDIRPPEDVPALMAASIQRSDELQGRGVWRHRWKDGSIRLVEVSVRDLDYDGRKARLVLALDVTETLKAEEALREARAAAERGLARSRAVMSSMADGLVVADQSGKFVDWNPAALWMHDFASADEMRSHYSALTSLFTVSPQGGEPLPLEDWPISRVLRGEAITDCELHVRRLDSGKERIVSYSGAPVRGPDGQIELAVLTLHDVTEGRWAEEELRRTAYLLRAVAEGITDAVYVKDREGRYLLFNEAAGRFVGRDPREVLGNDDRALFDEVSAERVMSRDRRVMESDKAETAEEVLTAAGVTRTYLATKAPYRDELGNVIGLIGISRDITERRKLEEQYRQSQKMEVVGRLAGGVAHDFNNLLTVINGYGDLVLSVLPSSNPARESVAEMVKAGERAAALTRQLLAFSRQQLLAPRVLSLNTVIGEMEKMLRRVIGEDIELATKLTPSLGHVQADPGQLEQVLLNLAVNARDAMPRGGKLTLETSDVELDEASALVSTGVTPGRYALLAVSDTGMGMSPEVRARVFEPFFTTKGPGKGTGLGLATVHGIVSQSGGRIEVYSEIGHGTTFKVYLPQMSGLPLAGRRSHPGTAGAPRGRETILLAEDEESVRALSRHVLSECGYAVLEAADGEEALALVARENVDIHLLVSDVVMPGIGGRELAERMQALRPELRVLYISGYADDAIIRHGVLEADVNFLQKPFSAGALARKVREVLDG